MLKIVYNKIGDAMSSKLLKSYEGKLIFLYGGPNKTVEETLERLFQSSSDNWSKDYVKLVHALKEVKLWYQRIEKLNFLSLSTFLKFYQLFQKDKYQKNDQYVLECLKLDATKKLKDMNEAEKERIYFLLLYQLNLNIYVFQEPFLHQSDVEVHSMLKLIYEKIKKHQIVFLTSRYQIGRMEQMVTDVLIVSDHKIKFDSVSKICHYNYSFVHLKGKNYKKLKLSIKNIILKEQTDDEIVFLYCGKFHELFQVLQTVELEDVIIRKQTLEEVLRVKNM